MKITLLSILAVLAILPTTSTAFAADYRIDFRSIDSISFESDGTFSINGTATNGKLMKLYGAGDDSLLFSRCVELIDTFASTSTLNSNTLTIKADGAIGFEEIGTKKGRTVYRYNHEMSTLNSCSLVTK